MSKTVMRILKTPKYYCNQQSTFTRSQLKRLIENERAYFNSHAHAQLSVERHDAKGDFTDTFVLDSEKFVDLLVILATVVENHDHYMREAAIELLCCFDI